MKTMTCSQLGGACEMGFHADTWEEMKKLSMQHGHEMAEKGDKAHLEVMEKMKEMMNDPKAMEDWMSKKQEEFNALQEDN